MTRPRIITGIGLLIACLCPLLARAETPRLRLPKNKFPPAMAAVTTCGLITWRGVGDGRFGNPRNWEGGSLPRPCTIVRFDDQSSDTIVDTTFNGTVAGILMDEGFRGTIRLERDVLVKGELQIAAGRIEQNRHALVMVSLTQTGGHFVGGDAPVWIEDAAIVSGGLFTTPHNVMRVNTLDIRGQGIVRIGANGKLNIAGDGEPLTGDGWLDTTTNPATSVEYTGHATSDITTAEPARGFRNLARSSREQDVELRRRLEEPGTTDRSRHGFGVAGTLAMSTGENYTYIAMIDTVKGFAYFATNYGVVVKINLADFVRVGALNLDPNGTNMTVTSGFIDPEHGFAYCVSTSAATGGNIIKIDLSTFSRVDTLQFAALPFSASVFDPNNRCAYIGAYEDTTHPGKLIKVNLTTFALADALILDAGEITFSTAVLDPAKGFLYLGLSNHLPSKIIKINVATFTRIGTLTLDADKKNLTSATIDPTKGFAYFGTETGHVMKIDLASFTVAAAVKISDQELISAILDSKNGIAYFGTSYSTIVKVELASFTKGEVLSIPGYLTLDSAVIDSNHGFAYFAGNDTADIGTPFSAIIKLDLASFTANSLLLQPPENTLYSAVIDTSNGFAYFGTNEGRVVKINISTFARVSALILDPVGDALTSAIIDPDHGFAYFGSNRGHVFKIDLATFSQVGILTLDTGNQGLSSAVIDPTNGFAYFGTCDWGEDTSPARIIKINLDTFKATDTLTLNPGQRRLTTAVIDPGPGFAYFGTFTSPARVVKIDLKTFTQTGEITLKNDEQNIPSAVIDTDHGFAYFGFAQTQELLTTVQRGSIVKINLTDFTRVGTLTLTPPSNDNINLWDAVIDTINGFAYFGAHDSDYAAVVKVNLATFSSVNEITGISSEAAIIDPVKGYSYFSEYRGLLVPSNIVRIDLGNTTTSVVSSTRSAPQGEPVTLTATVKAVVADGGMPAGTVAFKDNGAVIAECAAVVLIETATATCMTTTLIVGLRTITAEYSGDIGFNHSAGVLEGGQIITDKIPPQWPTGSQLVATGVSDSTVTLNWTAATDSTQVANYRMYKDGELVLTLDDKTTTTITNLSQKTSYRFKVEAGDIAGNWSKDGPTLEITTRETGLILHLALDETSGTVAFDSSGFANHGSVEGGAKWVAGHNGNALSFDGIDDAIQVDWSSSLARFVTNNEITITAWFKLTGHSDYDGIFSDMFANSLRLLVTPDMHILYDAGTHTDVTVTSTNVSLNTWTHIAMTIKAGEKARIYFNGARVWESSVGVPRNLQGSPGFFIGGGESIGRHAFQGLIDEARMYDRVLSDSEIHDVFSPPVNRKPRRHFSR